MILSLKNLRSVNLRRCLSDLKVTTDRFATYGALAGMAAAGAMGGGVLTGIQTGFNVGTISTGVYNNFLKPKSA